MYSYAEKSCSRYVDIAGLFIFMIDGLRDSSFTLSSRSVMGAEQVDDDDHERETGAGSTALKFEGRPPP
jgi:hypothetical protein